MKNNKMIGIFDLGVSFWGNTQNAGKFTLLSRTTVREALRRFEIAARIHEMRGSLTPEECEQAIQEYRFAKTSLWAMLGLGRPSFKR